MRADVLTDIDALAALEPAWRDLFGRVPDAPAFMAPGWLLPWWRAFAPGALFTVAVWSGDRLVGLAPLYTEEGSLGRRLLPLGIGLSDALDLLVDSAHVEPVGRGLTACVRGAGPRWTCWSAEDAPPGAAVLDLPDPAGWTSRTLPQNGCPVLDLASGPDGLPAAIPPRKRRKWRMALNRTARRAWSIGETTPATLPDDLAALFRLHGARWRGRGEAGVLADEAIRRFHIEAAPALLEAGMLRLLVLRIDGAVAGVYYGLHHGTTACAYLGGFDPAFAFESPGTVLIGAAIGRARADGARRFSFLRGQEPYKYEWGAIDSWTRRRLFEPVA